MNELTVLYMERNGAARLGDTARVRELDQDIAVAKKVESALYGVLTVGEVIFPEGVEETIEEVEKSNGMVWYDPAYNHYHSLDLSLVGEIKDIRTEYFQEYQPDWDSMIEDMVDRLTYGEDLYTP